MANLQNVTLAARKTGETWEAALVVDGKFMRAFKGLVGENLGTLVGGAVLTHLNVGRNEGTEISINLIVNEPDAD